MTKAWFEMPLIITFETNGLWIAEIKALPGVLAYGTTQAEASSAVQLLAKNVIANKLAYGELINDSISFFEEPNEN